MTYLLLCVAFLLGAVVWSVILSRGVRPVSWVALGLATLALFSLTAVFDSVMIASGLFTYARGTHLGLHLGLAPIEDFAYPLAAIVLLPALWSWFARSEVMPPATTAHHHESEEIPHPGDIDAA